MSHLPPPLYFWQCQDPHGRVRPGLPVGEGWGGGGGPWGPMGESGGGCGGLTVGERPLVLLDLRVGPRGGGGCAGPEGGSGGAPQRC